MTAPNITLEPGCYLDGSRGHYITRDAIEFAIGAGFIVDPFAQYALDRYEEESHEEDYPHEALRDLCDEAVAWLNSTYPDDHRYPGAPHEGQNRPPAIPVGHSWDFNDGDFGLYPDDSGYTRGDRSTDPDPYTDDDE